MCPLRLRSHLAVTWRGTRYVRGRIYTPKGHDDYLAMMGSGLFTPAEIIERLTPPEIAARQAKGLEVVVVRDAGLGDTLMALPYVQEFQRLNPGVGVCFAVNNCYAELMAEQPGLSCVYRIEDGFPGTRMIDLRKYVERHPEAHRIPRQELFGRAFGIDRGVKIGKLSLKDEWCASAKDRLAHLGYPWEDLAPPPIVSLTASGSVDRRSYWPTFAEDLQELLRIAGAWVVLTDMPDGHDMWKRNLMSQEMSQVVGFGGRLTIPELAGLLSLAHVVIGPDTGVLHLGAHLGKPLVGIFTDWPARLRLSPYNAYAFEPFELTCHPCHDRGCDPKWCRSWADPREVAAAAIACLAPRWNLSAPTGSELWRESVSVFGQPETR